jgi:PAS domain S-box-containing protein
MRTMASSQHGSIRPGRAPDLQLVIDSIPGLIHTSLPDGYLDFFNQPWLSYVGRSLEALQGWKWTAAIHPEDVAGIVEKWRASLASGEPFLYEARVRRADGEYRWMLHRKIPLRDEHGAIVKWYGSSIDIEERKRAEDELRRSEFYLTAGQRLVHAGSWSFTPAGICEYWSEELFDVVGFDPANGIPTVEQYLTVVHPDDVSFLRAQLDKMAAEGVGCDLKYRIIHPERGVRFVRSVGEVVFERGILTRFVGTTLDITEQEHLTQELRSREAYLAEAQRLSHTGSFGWRVSSGELVWSEETFRIFDCDPATKPSVDLVLQRVHPEDAALVHQTIERAAHEGKDFDFEHRLLVPDGSLKHAHVVAHALSVGSGSVEFVGAVMDITAAKQTEEKIREQEIEVRQMLDLAPQHVYVQRADGRYLHANQAALDYYGMTLEEFRNSDRREVLYPGDLERLENEVRSKFLNGLPHEGEARLRRNDGVYHWFLFRRNPLHDEHGRLTRWYLAATDIEERKQAEQRLQRENVALREEIDSASMFEEIVGSSPALRVVLSRVSKVGPTDSTVLLTGETGTGKELIARAVHKRSSRSSRGFVSVNCAAIPTALIAPELFGHEKGAFTGALHRRLGRFELAEGGTIFLDEVGELPMETQVTLLRVLQEREFERVGGNQVIRADVRVVAATNRDLEAAIAAGTFRKDLFYRLNVFPIEIPPLRERKEDIPMLVEYFIDRYARKAGRKIRNIQKKSMELLRSYSWPGNIRELQNVVERSVIVCESETMSVDESWLSRATSGAQPSSQPLAKKSAAQQAEIIETALARSGGRVSGASGAAVLLGMPASTLESKIRSLKINKFRFKATLLKTTSGC